MPYKKKSFKPKAQFVLTFGLWKCVHVHLSWQNKDDIQFSGESGNLTHFTDMLKNKPPTQLEIERKSPLKSSEITPQNKMGPCAGLSLESGERFLIKVFNLKNMLAYCLIMSQIHQ